MSTSTTSHGSTAGSAAALELPKVELGRTGEEVSALSLGAMQFGTLAGEEESFALLDRYVADGGDFIDTADCYSWWWEAVTPGGQSEELLGRWMAARGNRDRVFLATKASAMLGDLDAAWGVRPDGSRLDEPDWAAARRSFVGASPAVLTRSLDDSLRRLGTDRIDLYYVHVDDLATPLEETLETLAGFVSAGKVRHLGWSNVRTWRLERIRQLCERNGWPAPVALQQEHTFLRRRAGLRTPSIVDDEQLDYLEQHPELQLVAYSPLLKGLYDDQSSADANWMFENYRGPDAEARFAALNDVAERHGVRPGQVVIGWMQQRRAPRAIPLIGTSRIDRYREAAAGLTLPLTAEDLQQLDEAGA